jgi:VanZ family protein
VLKKLYLFAALSWTSFIFFLCLVKSSQIPVINIVNFDKLVHASFHFVFTILWFLYFKQQFKKRHNNESLVFVFLLSVGYGIGIEIAQLLFTATRSADVLDIVANIVGAIAGISIIVLVSKLCSNKIT